NGQEIPPKKLYNRTWIRYNLAKREEAHAPVPYTKYQKKVAVSLHQSSENRRSQMALYWYYSVVYFMLADGGFFHGPLSSPFRRRKSGHQRKRNRTPLYG